MLFKSEPQDPFWPCQSTKLSENDVLEKGAPLSCWTPQSAGVILHLREARDNYCGELSYSRKHQVKFIFPSSFTASPAYQLELSQGDEQTDAQLNLRLHAHQLRDLQRRHFAHYSKIRVSESRLKSSVEKVVAAAV